MDDEHDDVDAEDDVAYVEAFRHQRSRPGGRPAQVGADEENGGYKGVKKEPAITVGFVVIVVVFGIVIAEEGNQIGSVIVVVIIIVVITTIAAVVVDTERDCVTQWVF